jgi:hypothetical protein
MIEDKKKRKPTTPNLSASHTKSTLKQQILAIYYLGFKTIINVSGIWTKRDFPDAHTCRRRRFLLMNIGN